MPISKENRKRYPKDWKLRSKFVRYYRADGVCEWCGAVEGDPCSSNMMHPVILTVAHVYDKRPEAASLLNLAALCQKCHLQHDMKDHVRKRRENREDKRQLELEL